LSAALQDERTRLMRMVVQTHRHLSDTLGRELQQAVGISPVFFDVLIHVAAAPGGRLTMSQLSAEVALTKGGVTRLVDRMVGAGLVDRENSSKDRRSIQVVLTTAGREALTQAIAVHIESIERHLFAPLNDDDRASLVVALTKILGRERVDGDVLRVG